jgi:hypothetical protein
MQAIDLRRASAAQTVREWGIVLDDLFRRRSAEGIITA